MQGSLKMVGEGSCEVLVKGEGVRATEEIHIRPARVTPRIDYSRIVTGRQIDPSSASEQFIRRHPLRDCAFGPS